MGMNQITTQNSSQTGQVNWMKIVMQAIVLFMSCLQTTLFFWWLIYFIRAVPGPDMLALKVMAGIFLKLHESLTPLVSSEVISSEFTEK